MASRDPVPYSSSGRRSLTPFDPLLELHREMDRLFDTFLGGSGLFGQGTASAASAMTMPRIDVREDERELCVSADMPGIKPADIDVRVEGDVLTIRGERKSEAEHKDESYHVMERGQGRFKRSVQLPFTPDPDQVAASFDHGVLTIRMPRQAQVERSRRIEVREGSEGGGRLDLDVGSQGRTDGGQTDEKEATGTQTQQHH